MKIPIPTQSTKTKYRNTFKNAEMPSRKNIVNPTDETEKKKQAQESENKLHLLH